MDYTSRSARGAMIEALMAVTDRARKLRRLQNLPAARRSGTVTVAFLAKQLDLAIADYDRLVYELQKSHPK